MMKKFFPVLQYINVPNSITTLGMIFGIVACYYLIEGNLQAALVCLFFSSLMDLFDGFFAYKLKQQTQFGQYVDSLVDFFICCIIPVWLVYSFIGSYIALISALAFYCICGLWRLAYYNVSETDNYFIGLPVPGAMLTVCISVWSVVHYGLPNWIIGVVLFITGLLMVSFIRLHKYGLWQKVLCVVGLFFLAIVVTA